MPTISVIIPAYNAEKTILETISSVEAQTFSDFELISVSGADDWDYWIPLAHNWPFEVVAERQIFYRQSSGSVSSKVEVMEKNNLMAIEKGFQAAPVEMQSLENQSLAYTYSYIAHL